MRRIALLAATVLCIIGFPAFADWQAVKGDGLGAVLGGQRVVYVSGAWQTFATGGRTLYNAGQDQWGRWVVRGDQYCSLWPPSDQWSCYDVEIDGRNLRFTGGSGDVTLGRFAR